MDLRLVCVPLLTVEKIFLVDMYKYVLQVAWVVCVCCFFGAAVGIHR